MDARHHCQVSEDDSDDSQEDDGDGDENAYTVSFVDLDGTLHFLSSTRKRQELRIREAKFINKSLSALGSVIAALAQPKQQQRHGSSPSRVPTMLTKRTGKAVLQHPPPSSSPSAHRHIRFRDSQLTKLLQSRLMTDKGRLLLIATVDDQVANLTETLSTLKFASQCRRVELRSPQSKAEAAAKKRKDSLLEQVFLEMKTTYEEREAALHREYQSRLQTLEDRLQVNKNDAKVRQDSRLGISSFERQAAAARDRFVREREGDDLVHQRALRKVQTAIKASSTSPKQLVSTSHSKINVQTEDVQEATQRSGLLTGAVLKSSSSGAAITPEPASAQSASAPAVEEKSEKSEKSEKPKAPSEPEMTLTRRLLATTTLLPSQEGESQAIARFLLASPASLGIYHAEPNEEIDSSFSQLD